ncbi:hypothetical protein J5Y09_03665 [Roseomonas sp. PWR1]|uniref:Uncharacterized protein n=1 Tax=Roseomonas nitratireducens TaxID=2820810 RepID=A0ABS4ANR5_9PROT|nr:hypothetical protein [Neoroseomonas nitratireducens]MBP0462996.1 hypothetical protein [Neoroseomonas nitratireducens]
MSSSFVAMLHHEERTIVAEMRASKPFQRLEGVRRLLALYDAQPSVASGLELHGGDPARGAEVISINHGAPAAQPSVSAVGNTALAQSPYTNQGPVQASAIPMPAPQAAPAQAAVAAEAAVAEVVRTVAPPAPVADPEPASVVSSVRAALLGIGGKN